MKRLLATRLLFALAACSSGNKYATTTSSSSPGAAGSPAAVATNDTGFPLYSDAKVINSSGFKQNVRSQVVTGKEVVAETPASMSDLNGWIKGMVATPPAGYALATSNSNLDTARTHARAYGVDFQAFTHTVNGKKYGTLVVAIDPATFNEKLKPVLGLVDKYGKLPQMLRDPVDAQFKAKTGFTVTEALSPSSPLGAAIVAAQELGTSGERAIVVVDGTKQ